MAMKSDTNANMYFILGGLVVLAIVFGFLFFANSESNVGNLSGIEPLAGTEEPESASGTQIEMNISGEEETGPSMQNGQNQ